MAHKLSEGFLEIIMNGGKYDNPVLQVLGYQSIQSTNDRIRLLVSDGKHSHNLTLLSSHLKDKVLSGELSIFSIIKVNKYGTCSITNKENRRIMVIEELTIMVPGLQVREILGNPQTWSEDMVYQENASASTSKPAPTPTSSSNTTAGINSNSSELSSQMIRSIASLIPYQNKWVIKARVFSKTAIHTWSNPKGEGKLFSMDLCDESGEIRATAFKNECDKFYDMIKIDKVYYISRCKVQTANKQFTNLKNDYEMIFNANTVVSECMEEDNSVPIVKYDFMPISDIANKSPDTILDVIGVCISASDVQELTAKITGKLLKKREVTIVDLSGGAITLTLWDNEAEKFEGSNNPVVVIKGARLTEFNGIKSLSCLKSSMLRVDPDAPDAHKLRDWYDNEGNSMPIAFPTSSSQWGGNAEWMTFAEVEDQGLGTGDRVDYFSLLGVLTFSFAENAVYKACPQERCNKKLDDQQNGLFRCKKCDREHSNYKYQLLLAATVSDPTGDQRVTAFSECAEALLGRTAEEVGRLFEYHKMAFAQFFDDLKFKTFVFTFKTEMETYRDEARLKTVIMKAQPVDYRDVNARLIKSIKALSGVEI